ncbi:beta-lactamase family protein [Arthrobacter echini]|uniref:Beta-lactamase family protein n=1 Tax=Arthrobacter echini TaxID=1529066 RepID=A0A5D0XIM3_9MICC|nr:serine hydrolase domain-containing protein [Arthrobacter echini]TYC96307.1 beta-lactamase family protein [Arthrobacter echini]
MTTPRAVASLKQFALHRTHGETTRDVNPQNCAEMPFEWASITKTLTAAITYQLHFDGHLDLDQPISKTGGPYTEAPAWITPRSLVDHRSGLPRMPEGMTAKDDPYRGMTRDRFRELLPALWGGVVEPVGHDPDYSNLGYAVLTDVLEQHTDHTWQQLATTHLSLLGITQDVYTDVPDGGLVRKTLLGRTREPWSLGDGPFIGAGGLWGTLDALITYGQASRDWSKTFPASTNPPGWASSEDYWWHTGGSRDGSAIVLFNDVVVVAASTIGFGPFEAEKVARKELLR